MKSSGAFLVTGGSSGIGAAIVAELAEHGYRVGVLSRRPIEDADDGVLRVAHLVDWLRCDLFDADGAQASARKWVESMKTPLVGVVFSAVSYGRTARGPLSDGTRTEFERLLSVNVCSQFQLSAAIALPRFLASGSGLILTVSSVAAFEPSPGRALYAATKAASLAMFRSLAAEVKGTGISVVQAFPKNQIATPGLRARRPPEFDFAGYDRPDIFRPLVAMCCADTAGKLNGAVVEVDSSGACSFVALPILAG